MADQLPDYQGGAGRIVEATPTTAPELRPALSGYLITPSAAVLNPPVKALWVNQSCNLTLTGADGVSFTISAPGAGPIDLAPVKVTAISTGTVIGLHDGTA